MVTKIAVAGIDPVLVGILRTAVAALIALPLVAFAHLPRPRTRGEFGLLTASTLGGFVGFPVLFSIGQQLTSAAHGALILASLPVFTGLFAAVADRRPPGRLWWTGATIALIGEALLVGARFGFGAGDADLAGDLIILASCCAASLGYVSGGHLSRSLGAWPTTLWGIAAGGLVLAPVLALAIPAESWAAIDTGGWLAIGYLALLSTIAGYVAWYWALGHGGIARIGVTQFAQPVVGVLLAVAILGETLTWPLVGAGGCILAGVILARRG